jgi:hypothetical protein
MNLEIKTKDGRLDVKIACAPESLGLSSLKISVDFIEPEDLISFDLHERNLHEDDYQIFLNGAMHPFSFLKKTIDLKLCYSEEKKAYWVLLIE